MTQKNLKKPLPPMTEKLGADWIDRYLPGSDQAQAAYKRVVEAGDVDPLWRNLPYKQIPLGIKRDLLQHLLYELDVVDFNWIDSIKEEGDPLNEHAAEHAFDMLHHTYQEEEEQ